MDIIKTQLKVEDPIETYKEALRNAGPIMEIRSRRCDGLFSAPHDVVDKRRYFNRLVLRIWLANITIFNWSSHVIVFCRLVFPASRRYSSGILFL